MKATKFKSLLAGLASLTPSQRKKLAEALSPTAPPMLRLRSMDALQPYACPHCLGEKVVRNVVCDGLQRYLYQSCSWTFNATTGTPLSRLRNKEQFDAYADCMRQGLSVRAAAARVGLTVDKAFRWRHRFLRSVVQHKPKGVVGLLKFDETYFRESQKGTRKLTRPARCSGS